MKQAIFPVGSFFPAQTGGPDNTVYWITKALKKKKNFDPVIIATERGLDKEVARNSWLDTDYGKVIYTKNLIHYFPVKLIITALRQMKNADLVHLAMLFYPASFIIAIINHFFYKKPVLWSVHGDLDPYMVKRSGWKKRPVLWIINNLLKKHVAFHATCPAEVQYIVDNFGEEVEIITIPNYMEFSAPIKTKKEKSFLYIGRIHPKKAIENLIEALDLSKNFRGSGFNLKIAGNADNPYGEKLRAQAKKLGLEEQVIFEGHVEGDHKQQLLAESYFSFMPSHTENFGIVVMEALAQYTPVVASKGTPWGLLEEDKAGFWTENAPQTLADTIDRILEMDEPTYKTYTEQARKLALREFDIYEKINVWQDAYKQITK